MDSTWGHLKAPQWRDFDNSPQLLDDNFFSTNHMELETPALAFVKPRQQNLQPVAAKVQALLSDNEIEYGIELDAIKSTPIKVISPKSIKNEAVVKETTYNDVISQAMKNLQLSVKRNAKSQRFSSTPSKMSKTPSRSSKSICNKHTTPSACVKQVIQISRNTPVSRVKLPTIGNTRQSSNADKASIDDSNVMEEQSLTSEILQDNFCTIENAPNNCEPPKSVDNLPTAVKTEVQPEKPTNDEEITNAFETRDNVASKTATGSNKVHRETHMFRQPHFPACQFRRRSLAKYRRRSNKFVSLAEAVSKFQHATPERFRSMNSRNNKPAPLSRMKQLRVTQPISPALKAKSRSRPVTVLSREEKEQLEFEEIQKHRIKAKPVRASTLKGPAPLKKVEKKQVTVPQPFHLTESKKSCHSSTQSLDGNPMPRINRAPRKRVTMPIVVSTEDGLTLKETEILDFGIPDVSRSKKSRTKVVPFSFEERNAFIQKKKEEKIKQLITESEKEMKVPFHAKPVPSFKKPTASAAKSPTETKVITQPCPFSFEEREKSRPSKKAQIIQNILEEDRRARIFVAQPVPELRPVFVRGSSKENVNAQDATATMQKGSISSRSKLAPRKSESDLENQNPAAANANQKSNNGAIKKQIIPKVKKVLTEIHLNTEKRAKQRREFDEKIRQKEEEDRIARQKILEDRLAREEAEKAQIRKMAEVKARPMPVFKPPTISKSDKPLTEPQSPAWALRSPH